MIKKIIIISISAAVLIGALAFFLIMRTPGDKSFYYDPGAPFITDINESRRLLKSDIIILCSGEDKHSKIYEQNHRLRDAIIFILREKTEDELQSEGIKEYLNEEIINKLNDIFDSEGFIRIYFNEFVIQ